MRRDMLGHDVPPLRRGRVEIPTCLGDDCLRCCSLVERVDSVEMESEVLFLRRPEDGGGSEADSDSSIVDFLFIAAVGGEERLDESLALSEETKVLGEELLF